jgi:hypothetical protein
MNKENYEMHKEEWKKDVIYSELNNTKYGRMIMGLAEKMSRQLPVEKTREMLKVRKVVRGKSI